MAFCSGCAYRMTVRTIRGKTIVLAVTGSIAAVETIKLAHSLEKGVQRSRGDEPCSMRHYSS